jgi:hypothetical protein
MADLKISQLTGASTPLAGTEVLPIVQSGVTKQVSVSNLTIGRTVGTGAINATGAITLNNSIPLNWKNGSGTTRNVMQVFGNDLYIDSEDGAQILRTGGYERLRLDLTGNATVSTGNLVIGTAGKSFVLPGGISWTSGAGSPEGVVTAPVGSLYSRSDGGLMTSLYVKESGSGNTGWVNK